MENVHDPHEIYKKICGDKSNFDKEQENRRALTRTSEKIDSSVKTFEDRVISWQETINNWRIAITQNEQGIIIFYIIFGMAYAFAINECTGNLDFPWYAYFMMGIIVIMSSLLQIPEGALQLVTILKYAVSISLGHVCMMWIIAVDGHAFRILTTDVCRYPVASDFLMGVAIGGPIGFIVKTYEEIMSKGKR